ncbi:MAG: tRNA (adenosine(37)-N6)-dimethylallyltransferase MiaA [Burkholderiaceae bacterium]|nr:tRNA (adenosine(37)-N6)-dimethylallyltransferase MiaA [Burkholderiaceae bacterium]
MMLDAVFVLGPTASGKTALGIEIAKVIPAEVISIDSALVYRQMDVGSAKPTAEEMAGIPHHLIDVRDPFESYSAADFVRDCTRLIKEIQARGKLPLIVGGTMLYAKALKEGLNQMPTSDLEVRREVEAEAAEIGWPGMHAKLAEVDPITAARLMPNDSQRISRALEVYRQTGKPISWYQAQEQKGSDFEFLTLGLLPGDRKVLHERIAKRFDIMLEQGFLDEVKRLMAMPQFDRAWPSMRAVGYRQAIDYLLGEIDYDRFLVAGVAATRQLAKRQMTWMRSMDDIHLMDPLTEDVVAKALALIEDARSR